MTATADARAAGDLAEVDAGNPIHVCHFVQSLAVGGLETQLKRIVEASANYPVTHTVCYFGDDDSMQEEMESAGARVVSMDTVSPSAAAQFHPRTLGRVTAFLRREEFDIVHTHTSLCITVVGRLCGRLAGIPVVGTYHNTRDNFHPTTRFLERATRRLSAADIAVSHDVSRSYTGRAQRYTPDRVSKGFERDAYTIHNGIDVDSFAEQVRRVSADGLHPEASDDGVVFLTVGRYVEEKNQGTLIRAMADVVEDLPDAHLFVVGWGPLETQLRRTAERQGVSDNVTVTGRVPSVHEYYALADVFVLPSLTEGLSVVLLEAMSAGLPVIGTDVAGTAEAIADGTTGYLVPPNSSAALADAMRKMRSADRRERLGRNGQQRARDSFSIQDTVESYIDIYRRVV